ncbi:Ig-like domain-containing protein [Olleya sp. HaHaR_3_96]|uniref:Ig-like domain-containing protein n=1 Tax=Olleya sp. HaHaR_3_96 TaxID=2745560 RepID=UPI001C4FA177|nr:Ig-like domain-containing protein [Olleya sp. HaHaR_3_96]QXP60893.1 Ig-like domain-containing protein [Olleya sp. HaHaR_3_96]
MQNRLLNFCFYSVLALTFINCANRGNVSGGEKDITPPVILKTIPENYSTNFNSKEIRIYFDEYVKTKDLTKQLVISPPMKETPDITPLGTASKYVTIKISDTLQPNTTYAINFGNSIVDNNEENPYPYYRYVFSTGSHIDSLSVKGSVMDAIKRQTDPFISVHLYEADSTYTDSIVYKENPKYITNTLDSTTNFKIENLKAGLYKLVAIKDNNSNNKFEQSSDEIGFYKDFITVSNDTTAFYKLKLFKETLDYKAESPRLISGEKIAFGFQGEDYKSMAIDLLSDAPSDYEYSYFKDEKTDTLNYYYKPKLEVDSLIFKVTNKTIIDTFTVRIKDNKRDSLLLKANPSGNIDFFEPLKISANIPITKFDKTKINILDKDSTNVVFTTKFDTLQNTIEVVFDKTEDNVYKVQLLPNTVTDFFSTTNDTLNYSLRTEKEAGLGNARINIKNAEYPLIVQFVNKTGDVKYEEYATKAAPIDFFYLKPGEYYVRVIFDSNKNEKYDPGNFLKQTQAERVSYTEKVEEIRSGWEVIIDFTLD